MSDPLSSHLVVSLVISFVGVRKIAIPFFAPLGKQNKLRVYYLSWLKAKILKGEEV